MSGLATIIVLVVLCTATFKAALGCPRGAAVRYYRRCVDTVPQPAHPPVIRDAAGQPLSLYYDMSGVAFNTYLTEKCMQKRTRVDTCFQKFFTTPEGRKCGDPEPLTVESQSTGGFCGDPEGARAPWADAVMMHVGKWNNACLNSPLLHNAQFYCMRDGQGPPATAAGVTEKIRCIINSISFGKAEDCSRHAVLAIFLPDLVSNLGFGQAPNDTAINGLLATLPPS